MCKSGLDNYVCSKALQAPTFGGGCVIPITVPRISKWVARKPEKLIPRYVNSIRFTLLFQGLNAESQSESDFQSKKNYLKQYQSNYFIYDIVLGL